MKRSLVSRDSIRIANGAQLSPAIPFDKAGAMGLTLPAAFTGTHLGIFGSNEKDGTFNLLHDVDNTPIGVVDARASRTYVIFLAYPYPYIKLGFYTGTVSATVDATLSTQLAERIFTDLVFA